jgi:thymidine kinase
MFIEPHIGQPFNTANSGHGWIEVICGSMFSGKTEELIRRLNRVLIAQQKVEIFKPKVDTRHQPGRVVSHNENSIRSTTVEFARDIPLLSDSCEVVGIDEVQFFDEEIVSICRDLANHGKRVIAAGLDMDFQGQPFGSIPKLMAIAEYVTKLHAICVRCGGIASYSYRLNPEKEQVVVGEKNIYEARCRECFSKEESFND